MVNRHSGPGGSVSLNDGDPAGPLQLLVVPMPPNANDRWTAIGRRVCAAVFLTCPGDRGEPALELLSVLFELTPAEARLAVRLACGQPLNRIAERSHVSPHTVRTQLKRIFLKTDTHSQAELVAKVLASPAAQLFKTGASIDPDEAKG